MICPLCKFAFCREIGSDRRRAFYLCNVCDLVFVPPEYHLSTEQERRRYDLHDNTEKNQGYVGFLGQVADVAESVSPKEGRFLDFGCGKEAVLSSLLERRNRRCDCFDPLYEHTIDMENRYETVILCEVIEHCRNVHETLMSIRRLLLHGGAVIVRTQCRPDNSDLMQWWYVQDPAHVCFFSAGSLRFAANVMNIALETTQYRDIFVMR